VKPSNLGARTRRKRSTNYRNRAGILVLSLLAAVLGVFLYLRTGMRMGGAPSSLRSDYSTEEEWIVGEIVADIAEMGAYAHGVPSEAISISTEPGGGSPIPEVGLEVRVGVVARHRGTLSLEEGLWNPGSYRGLAEDLLGPGLPNAPPSHSGTLVETLLEAKAAVLDKEGSRVSRLLAANMRDGSAHEEAALLLAAFAMREAAYRFEDYRFLLGRMTAHLAVARSLRGGAAPALAGAVAEAALLVLAGRQEEALRAIESLSDGSSAASAWQRVLSLYTTLDWRRGPSSGGSLLERVQLFRAMVSTLGSTAAVARLKEAETSELPDWGRIVVWRYSGASADHGFVTSQMEKELSELREVWLLKKGVPLSPEQLTDQLNVRAGRLLGAAGPEVLPWGTWAEFYQRHICGLLSAAEELLGESLGMPAWAAQYRREARQAFSGLTLHPIVEVRRTRKAGGRVEDTLGMDDSIALARRSPELVNSTNWLFLSDTARHMMRKSGMPSAEAWFSRALLVTSVFDTRLRVRLLSPFVGNGDELLATLRRIAPHHHMVADYAVERLPPAKRTVEVVTRELGERAEFDLISLLFLKDAAEGDSEKLVPLLARTCDLDANECLDLGWGLAESGRDDEAAAAFQRAVDEAPDRIDVCNNVDWLVNHYYRRGQVERAREVAEESSGVACDWGLYTQAYLSERMGRLAEAERWYQTKAERYDAEKPVPYALLGFYYRMTRSQTPARARRTPRQSREFEPGLDRILPRIFPQGLERLSSAPEGGAPTDGVLIDGESKKLRDAALRGADVIVGLDGFRVHSLEQYDAIRNFQALPSDATELRLRVFRQTQYLDVDARILRRRFGVRVRTYGTPGPSFQER
jgi:hypothetical protein